MDDEMARIARDEVPGFAGYAVKNGRRTVFLTDVRTRATAVAALNRSLGEMKYPGGAAPAFERMDVAQARYDYNQLQTWRIALREPLFRDRGMSALDIDESRNRIVVGVVDDAARGRAIGLANQLHIPPDAIQTQTTPITCVLSTSCTPPPDTGIIAGPSPIPR